MIIPNMLKRPRARCGCIFMKCTVFGLQVCLVGQPRLCPEKKSHGGLLFVTALPEWWACMVTRRLDSFQLVYAKHTEHGQRPTTVDGLPVEEEPEPENNHSE